ncbi:thioesterase II family protein [Amycolatopsis sp. CA-230715]|uniref:thioesterase II family protein n=1 Tax=Amycolatopsis sp. CA-230715 TaxID=2745196 RepID=UPI001C031BFC|nr:alpha/beta fold hydrolase [Amycolatopsis sp. CA-230715]QWF84797.1 Thioesterase PikA5 [Amycolatopsis sp. CA-230715]
MTAELTRPRSWLRTFRPCSSATARLVCFPHSGGSAAFYRSWATALPSDVELVAVQYPGRLDRIREPLVDDMPTMVEAIVGELRSVPRGGLALFGHSMGASVAWEVAHRVAADALFVSGRPAPRHHRRGRRHLGSDDALWGHVRALGGSQDSLLDNAVVREVALPPLRADYRLIETHTPTLGPPLAAPIIALSGDADPEAELREVADWRGCTTGPFRLRTFSGGHFYLVPRFDEVTAAVTEELAAAGLITRRRPPR